MLERKKTLQNWPIVQAILTQIKRYWRQFSLFIFWQHEVAVIGKGEREKRN